MKCPSTILVNYENDLVHRNLCKSYICGKMSCGKQKNIEKW